MHTKAQVIEGVSSWTQWWIDQRKKKLREELSDTMSINPFLLPILFELHNFSDFKKLSEFIVGGHLMVGYNTGFGKLMDEKILPHVFGTIKLDKKYRATTEPLINSCFNEVDHIIKRPDGELELLSLKAGKWTIQLTMAMQLNAAFNEIVHTYGKQFKKIVVGVFYGSVEDLTDKYDILRGINRGAKHNVIDLTKHVSVFTGKAFWSWLNEGQAETQEWVLAGIKDGIVKSNYRKECGSLLEAYNNSMASRYNKYIKANGDIEWDALLKDING